MSDYCGIKLIDDLYSNATAEPVRAGDDPAAVGAVQDLLTGHGYRGLPGLTSPAYGKFGGKTSVCLQDFQSRHGLPPQDLVDHATLSRLVLEPASDPRACHVYVTLALGFPVAALQKTLSLVAQMEGMGRFAALNLNTDKAGLSYGIIQWAQRPGRLAELLKAFQAADAAQYAEIFGAGDAELARMLLRHAQKPGGGIDSNGETTNPAFNLIQDPWPARFQHAALAVSFQKVQVRAALTAFSRTLAVIRAAAPEAATERAVAFLLDVANQFGDAGMSQLCKLARQSRASESDLLESVAAESVERMPASFQMPVRARRDVFLHTPWLSARPFGDATP